MKKIFSTALLTIVFISSANAGIFKWIKKGANKTAYPGEIVVHTTIQSIKSGASAIKYIVKMPEKIDHAVDAAKDASQAATRTFNAATEEISKLDRAVDGANGTSQAATKTLNTVTEEIPKADSHVGQITSPMVHLVEKLTVPMAAFFWSLVAFVGVKIILTLFGKSKRTFEKSH